MQVFSTSVVFEKQLTLFLDCHPKTGKKKYQQILAFYGKTAKGLLSLQEVANYYELSEADLIGFTIANL